MPFFFFQLQENESPNFQSVCLKCVHMFTSCPTCLWTWHIPANKRTQCTKTRAVFYSNPFLLDKLHYTKLLLAVISIANMIWNILPASIYETLNRCVFMWVDTLGNSLSGNTFSWLTCSFIWQKRYQPRYLTYLTKAKRGLYLMNHY